MSGFPVPTKPPADFRLTAVSIEAAQVLQRLLEQDKDEVPDWVRKAAAGVDPNGALPANGTDGHEEPPGGSRSTSVDVRATGSSVESAASSSRSAASWR